LRLPDGGQRRIGSDRHSRVVESTDRDIVRDPAAGAPQRRERAGGEEVGRDEHGVEIRARGE
jgi:hypothetical protein